jgi:hypothetical protein
MPDADNRKVNVFLPQVQSNQAIRVNPGNELLLLLAGIIFKVSEIVRPKTPVRRSIVKELSNAPHPPGGHGTRSTADESASPAPAG